MIKKTLLKKNFLSNNHTIMTAFRHKQKVATLIPSNKKDQYKLVAKNIVIYISKNRAALNYRYGFCALPNVERNIRRLND